MFTGATSGSEWNLITSAQLLKSQGLGIDKPYILRDQIKSAQVAYHSFLQTFKIFVLQVEDMPLDDRATNVTVRHLSAINCPEIKKHAIYHLFSTSLDQLTSTSLHQLTSCQLLWCHSENQTGKLSDWLSIHKALRLWSYVVSRSISWPLKN